MSITIFQYLSFHKPIIMKQIVFSLLFLALLQSCNTKTPVDLIVYNANIYTVDDNFSKAEAMAIKDGKLVAVGTSEDITNSYTSDVQNDINGQTILPGFIDSLPVKEKFLNRIPLQRYGKVSSDPPQKKP